MDKHTLEARVIETTFSLIDDKSVIEVITQAEVAASKDTGPDPEQIKAELDSLRRLMTELFSDYYDHRIITREQFIKKNEEYLNLILKKY